MSTADGRRSRLGVLELYCGIGGCAAALGDAADVTAAVDVNRLALGVYGYNFPHRRVPALVESIAVDRLRPWGADLWWMSPPCQPFTRRGRRRDVDDPRAETLLALLRLVAEVRPRYVAFENVPGFSGSRGHRRLLETLDRAGYRSFRECLLCPTELGVPNRRRRYYLVAARGRLEPFPRQRRRVTVATRNGLLARYLDAEPAPELAVEPGLVERYRGALHVVRGDDPGAVTACFTSAYGRSPVKSGSYLATRSGVRRFSPAEILRLLGFPAGYRLPPDLPLGNAWRLVGDSLSIVAVRQVLAAVPELASLATVAPGPLRAALR